MRHQHRAFTLIELLVVIAIIALLLFLDGHSDWLSAENNTSRYWCGVEAP